MEIKENSSVKYFEDLTKSERKLLYKEFNKYEAKYLRLLLWFGLGLALVSLISVGFAIYYILNIFINNVVEVELYIFAVLFNLSGGLSLFFTSRYHKKFRLWLKTIKTIVYKDNRKE